MFKVVVWSTRGKKWLPVLQHDNATIVWGVYCLLKAKHPGTSFAFVHPRTKPILCRYCKLPVPDIWVLRRSPSKWCSCTRADNAIFTSQPTPIDLQWYDKFST